MPKKEFPLPEFTGLLDVVVKDQAGLALNIAKTQRGNNAIEGQNISYRLRDGRLEIQRGATYEEDWISFGNRPNANIGLCTVNFGDPRFKGIGKLLMSGDIFMKARVLDGAALRIGYVGINRIVSDFAYGAAAGRQIQLNDAIVGKLQAHVVGGGVAIDNTRFDTPSVIVRHGATYREERNVSGDLSTTRFESCNEACRLIVASVEALQNAE